MVQMNIIERIITYDACAFEKWKTPRKSHNKINIYRTNVFILNFKGLSKGYRAISTDALNIITDIPPIALTFKYVYTKSDILHLEREHFIFTLFSNNIIEHYPNSPSAILQLTFRLTSHSTDKLTKFHKIIIHSSRTHTGVAEALRITEEDMVPVGLDYSNFISRQSYLLY